TNRRGSADLLMTYCSSAFPRLAVNEAGALNTNTLHAVSVTADDLRPEDLAAGFHNSLTLLCAELVGRSYGGGVLKLEPTEASSLLMPPIAQEVGKKLREVDRLIR